MRKLGAPDRSARDGSIARPRRSGPGSGARKNSRFVPEPRRTAPRRARPNSSSTTQPHSLVHWWPSIARMGRQRSTSSRRSQASCGASAGFALLRSASTTARYSLASLPWQHRVARQHAVAQRVEAGDVGAAGLGRQGLWRCCRRPYPRFNSGAPCRAAQAFHEVHQAHGRPFLGGVMGSAPPFVGRPVHEPWPGGKLPEWPVQFLF